MPDLRQVTICAADSVHPHLASAALARSMAQCRFARAVLFTDASIDSPAEVVRISPLESLEAYSRFMLRDLGAHIDTSHVLVVQWDGFVTDGRLWDPAFLDYDYIGARWPWIGEGLNVGNGGFSLRSRRLLQALADPDFNQTGAPEDAVICRHNRRLLEHGHGIRFAPAEVADRFSYERAASQQPTFGFHGDFNLWRHLDPGEMLALAASLRPAHLISKGFIELLLRYLQQQQTDAFRELFACMSARVDLQALRSACREALGSDESAETLLQFGRFLEATQPSRAAICPC